MAGKSPLTASEEQRVALQALAVSRDRGEADRARAVERLTKGRVLTHLGRGRSKLCALRDALFDQFVGADEQRKRDFEAECLGGPGVDRQFEPSRKLNRQFSRPSALEDAVDVACGAAIEF